MKTEFLLLKAFTWRKSVEIYKKAQAKNREENKYKSMGTSYTLYNTINPIFQGEIMMLFETQK